MTENYFCTCHKSNRKHNQHLQLLFFKINLHSGTSNQISTYGKPNLLLINSNYLVFFSLEIQKRFMDSCRPIRILQVLYFVWKTKQNKEKTLTHKPSKVASTEKCFFNSVYVIGTTFFNEYFLFHMITERQSLRQKCPYSEFFWSVFSRIQTEYGEILFRVNFSEAVDQRCSVKKRLLEISQNSYENTCAWVFFNKVAGLY